MQNTFSCDSIIFPNNWVIEQGENGRLEFRNDGGSTANQKLFVKSINLGEWVIKPDANSLKFSKGERSVEIKEPFNINSS